MPVPTTPPPPLAAVAKKEMEWEGLSPRRLMPIDCTLAARDCRPMPPAMASSPAPPLTPPEPDGGAEEKKLPWPPLLVGLPTIALGFVVLALPPLPPPPDTAKRCWYWWAAAKRWWAAVGVVAGLPLGGKTNPPAPPIAAAPLPAAAAVAPAEKGPPKPIEAYE